VDEDEQSIMCFLFELQRISPDPQVVAGVSRIDCGKALKLIKRKGAPPGWRDDGGEMGCKHG